MARGCLFDPIWSNEPPLVAPQKVDNPLRDFFESRQDGPGIWKWTHYFDVYHRFFAKFRSTPVHMLEIGVFSGGSLDMWRSYFGQQASLYGVDIEPACKMYEKPGTRIFIGDQADRSLWQQFRRDVPLLDVVIDDGGHTPEQQMITLEELLPHIRPGGIYICEDIHQSLNPFATFQCGLARNLNAFDNAIGSDAPERSLSTPATALQGAIAGIHFYPFISVIERNSRPVEELVAPRHGSQWQPFYER
jgi:hypothetical protein